MQVLTEDFYLAVCFFLFLYLIYRPIKKLILKLLDEKINIIKNQIHEAKTLNSEVDLLFKNAVIQMENLAVLKEQMITECKNAISESIAKKTQEIDKFIEKKELEAIQQVQQKTINAQTALTYELTDRIVQLVKTYLTSHQLSTPSDIEIAKEFIKDPDSKDFLDIVRS